MTLFQLASEFQMTGDQPHAVDQLIRGIERGRSYQTLMGVTGSGKTFTMANIVAKLQRTTLVLAHNKTLAAQLAAALNILAQSNLLRVFSPDARTQVYVQTATNELTSHHSSWSKRYKRWSERCGHLCMFGTA